MYESEGVMVRCEPLNDIEQVAEQWRSLEPRSDASPFLSWLWIGSWLRLRNQWPNAYAVSAWQGSMLIGIALFFERTIRRAKIIPVKTLFINEAGEPVLDMIIEHNGFLMDSQFESKTSRDMCEFVEVNWGSIDEIFISGVTTTSKTLESLCGGSWKWKTERRSEGRFVNLTWLKSLQQSYLA